MQVADIMTTKVHTVNQHDLIDRVLFFLNYEKVRHVPVVEKGRVVGMVSDRDLYKALGSKDHAKVVDNPEKPNDINRVQYIMRRGVITTTPDAKVHEVASILAQHKVGALPVLENNKLVGIISTVDILKLISTM